MKKMISVLVCLLCASVLAGCCMSHEWREATCDSPKTCGKCGKTDGEALAHEWQEATCETPKTCALCGVTEGDVLDHSWQEATCTAPETCSVCGITQGEALEHVAGHWELQDSDENMLSYCVNCGAEMLVPLDLNVYAAQVLVGDWEVYAQVRSYREVEMDQTELTFHDDGTITGILMGMEVENASWAMQEEQSSYQGHGFGTIYYEYLVNGNFIYRLLYGIGNEDGEGHPAIAISISNSDVVYIYKK